MMEPQAIKPVHAPRPQSLCIPEEKNNNKPTQKVFYSMIKHKTKPTKTDETVQPITVGPVELPPPKKSPEPEDLIKPESSGRVHAHPPTDQTAEGKLYVDEYMVEVSSSEEVDEVISPSQARSVEAPRHQQVCLQHCCYRNCVPCECGKVR